MADGVFNVARGKQHKFAEEARDTAASALTIVLLKANESESTLVDKDDLSALLGDASNTEADFTNYSRKEISGGDVTITIDDTNDRVDVDIPDQTWDPAGNGTNNSLTKLLVCFDADTGTGTDSDITPMTHHDFSVTTDGSKLTAEINSSGIYRSS